MIIGGINDSIKLFSTLDTKVAVMFLDESSRELVSTYTQDEPLDTETLINVIDSHRQEPVQAVILEVVDLEKNAPTPEQRAKRNINNNVKVYMLDHLLVDLDHKKYVSAMCSNEDCCPVNGRDMHV